MGRTCFHKSLLLTLLFCHAGILSYGWGPTGHRVTGWIASQYVTKKTRAKIEKILGHESLAMASNWMDQVRSDSSFNYMEDWHWVTIPDGMTYADAAKNPDGDLIAALEKTYKTLKTGNLTLEEETMQLRILIHLVGDLHMPLHVGRENDQGGNGIRVMWFRNESNLHRVWDSDMIDDTRLSYSELAQSIEPPDTETRKGWQSGSFREWALENLAFRDQIYDIGNSRLGYAYSYRNFSLVKKRLSQAGVRLAAMLNDIYG